ncbi:MAG: site-specific integrase [Isosphaeraceae bacterium]
MPTNKPQFIPKYRRHASGQAVVTLSGRDFYLGRFGSVESREQYNRVTGEWLANGRSFPPRHDADDLTINELAVPFIQWAEQHYRKAGRSTGQAEIIKLAIRVLKELNGSTPAREFDSIALVACRQRFIASGLCRREANRRTRLIRQFFGWVAERRLVPGIGAICHELREVRALERDRTPAHDPPPIRPVPDGDVEAILPYCVSPVRAMIELQHATGMRPNEVVQVRTCDINRSGEVWTFRPAWSKVEHYGIERIVYLGPKAQAILAPFLRPDDPTGCCFRPPVAKKPSSRAVRPLKDHYTVIGYRAAIERACRKAGIDPWTPNRLRHAAASRIASEVSITAAMELLGHRNVATTQRYVARDHKAARDAMAKLG